jgi:hypothetical protein
MAIKTVLVNIIWDRGTKHQANWLQSVKQMWPGIAHLYYYMCGAKKLRSLFWLCVVIGFVFQSWITVDILQWQTAGIQYLETQQFLSLLLYLNGLGNRSSIPGEKEVTNIRSFHSTSYKCLYCMVHSKRGNNFLWCKFSVLLK